MKEQIRKIKQENPTWGYKKIANYVGCSKNTVKYHLVLSQQDYYKQKRKINKRKRLTELKVQFGGKCQICNYDKCLDALHFHHKNPNEKTDTVSYLFFQKSKIAALQEAQKCNLICANCHAEIHSKLVGNKSA